MKAAKRIKKIGLTGGIGAGKSTVARLLREEGIRVIDMDNLGRQLTDESPTIVKQITRLLGRNVSAQGKLDREAVRDAVFRDSQAKKDLENLLHPLIIREFEHQCDEAWEAGEKMIVCEAALLVESGHYQVLDELIVVNATPEIRHGRVVTRDNMSPQMVRKIMNAQLPDEKRLELATDVIQNDGEVEHLRTQIRPLLERWKSEGLL